MSDFATGMVTGMVISEVNNESNEEEQMNTQLKMEICKTESTLEKQHSCLLQIQQQRQAIEIHESHMLIFWGLVIVAIIMLIIWAALKND